MHLSDGNVQGEPEECVFNLKFGRFFLGRRCFSSDILSKEGLMGFDCLRLSSFAGGMLF